MGIRVKIGRLFQTSIKADASVANPRDLFQYLSSHRVSTNLNASLNFGTDDLPTDCFVKRARLLRVYSRRRNHEHFRTSRRGAGAARWDL